jgi:hypothetical protein
MAAASILTVCDVYTGSYLAYILVGEGYGFERNCPEAFLSMILLWVLGPCSTKQRCVVAGSKSLVMIEPWVKTTCAKCRDAKDPAKW